MTRQFRKWQLRLRSLFRRPRVETDLTDELNDYLEREIEARTAAGESFVDAHKQALAGLHGEVRLKEECRDARSTRWLEDLVYDLRYGLRTLRREPTFAVMAIAALAFCIGANTAIFSVVDTALFRPLPFANQDRLVLVNEGVPSLGFPSTPFCAADYLFVTEKNRSLERTAAYRIGSYELSGAGVPRRIIGARITASLFPLLGISPAAGHLFTQEEDDGGKPVAVLSYGLAQRAFGDVKNALGHKIVLERKPYDVIGVMPRSFSFPIQGARFNSEPAEFFIPVSWSKNDREEKLNNFDYSMIARLKPGMNALQANEDVMALLQRIMETLPPEILKALQKRSSDFRLVSEVKPLRDDYARSAQRPLLLLFAAVGVVLLIGCADVANLMFSRMVGRRREYALRSALGAGRWRLVRQTLTEGVILSSIGGAIGLTLAYWLLPLLLRFAPHDLPRLDEIAVNWRAAAFVAVVTLLTPVLFCLAPLIGALHSSLADTLRSGGRSSTQSERQRLAMSAGVILQFGLACLLLTAAGLLIRSFIKASEASPGFQPQHVLRARISLPNAAYQKQEQVESFYHRLLTSIESLPGVQQAGAISELPMGSTAYRVFSFQGRNTESGQVDTVFAMGDPFHVLGISLIRGRLPEAKDELRKPPVAVISEGLAKKIFGSGDPLGSRVKAGIDVPENGDEWMPVVGVFRDVKDKLTSTGPRRMLIMPPEDWVKDMDVVVRTTGDPLLLANSIRREVKQMDASLPVEKIETVEQVLTESLAAERFRTTLLASFAVAALLLAMLGIGGLLAYNTAQRAQEFGVRIALGASRRDVLSLVLLYCVKLAGLGIVAGLCASFVLTRVFSSLLYDTSPQDPVTLIVVPSILVAVALAAAIVPAWRALQADPITALRAE